MKRLITILILAVVVTACKAQGVAVLGPLTTNGTVDVYPTHVDTFGKGGLMTVGSWAERNLIPALRRKAGMIVRIKSVSVDSTYTLGTGLTNADWIPFVTGSTITNLNQIPTRSYNDLQDKPTPVDISGKANTDGSNATGTWGIDISGTANNSNNLGGYHFSPAGGFTGGNYVIGWDEVNNEFRISPTGNLKSTLGIDNGSTLNNKIDGSAGALHNYGVGGSANDIYNDGGTLTTNAGVAPVNITGNAVKWGNRSADWDSSTTDPVVLAGKGVDEVWKIVGASTVKSFLGLPLTGNYDLQDVTDRGNSTNNDIVISKDVPALILAGGQGGGKQYNLTSGVINVSNTGFGIWNASDNRNDFYIDGSGNSTTFGDINSKTGTIYSTSNISEGSGYRLNGTTIGYSSSNNYGWLTAGGASARTNLVLNGGGGNVGIGTTSPTEKLEVNGNINSLGNRLGFNTTDTFSFDGVSRPHYGLGYGLGTSGVSYTTLSGYYGLKFFTNGVNRGEITSGGSFNISGDIVAGAGVSATSVTASNDVIAGGDVSVNSNLTVTGTSLLNGDVVLANNAFIPSGPGGGGQDGYGSIKFYDNDQDYDATHTLRSPSVTDANLTWTLPARTGILATTSDIPKMFVATASGDGITTTFTVPHGLDYTPTMVIVTPNSSNALGNEGNTSNATPFYAYISGSNVVIEYHYNSNDNAPLSGTNNLKWTIMVK